MRPYYLADSWFHLRRFTDGSFRDRWSGFWLEHMKILNYFAVETDAGWTSFENATNWEKKTHREAMHEYDVNGEHVVESVKITDDGLVVDVAEGTAVALEVGICIRPVYEEKALEMSVSGNRVSAGRYAVIIEGGKVTYERGTQVQGTREYEIVRARVTGNGPFKIRVVHVPKKADVKVQSAPSGFSCDDPALTDLYRAARNTIALLERRDGWFAGLPWFTHFWGRDLFWSVPALISEGHAHKVRDVLLRFAYTMDDGEVPRLVWGDGHPEYGTIDTNALYILAVGEYVRRTKDAGLLREIRKYVVDAFYFFEAISDDYAVVEGKGTWMDSITRKYPIETQALWYGAAREMERLGLIKGEAEKIREAFEEKKMKYLLERSSNMLVAAMYGLVNAKEAVEFVEREGLVGEGIRTLSPHEMEYDPTGYHTGAAWGLTTGWGLYVSAMAGEWDLFRRLRDAIHRRLERSAVGCLDECWNPDTGEPLGADCQLWTGTMLIRVIDEVLVKTVPPWISWMKRTRQGTGTEHAVVQKPRNGGKKMQETVKSKGFSSTTGASMR